MEKEDKPLPQPPQTPFGRKRRFEQEASPGSTDLIADKLAAAAAAGKLDQVLAHEFPDNVNAQKLVSMMMGMTGFGAAEPNVSSGSDASPEDTRDPSPVSAKQEERTSDVVEEEGAPAASSPPAVSPEIVAAATAGDVAGLMEILRNEHRKRSSEPSPVATQSPEQSSEGAMSPPEPVDPPVENVFDRKVLDELIAIARDSGMEIDWLVARALALYVRDYRNTGRL